MKFDIFACSRTFLRRNNMGLKLLERKPLPITCPNDGKVERIRIVGGRMQSVYLTEEQVAEQHRRTQLLKKRWREMDKIEP